MNIDEVKNFKVSSYIWQKREFNVNSKKDLADYRNFLQTNSWGSRGCPFVLEYPYLTIPDMIKDKLIGKYIDSIYEQAVTD